MFGKKNLVACSHPEDSSRTWYRTTREFGKKLHIYRSVTTEHIGCDACGAALMSRIIRESEWMYRSPS